jgi:hypothetical protein
MPDSFRLGRWRRSTRSSGSGHRIAEGDLLYGHVKMSCSLHLQGTTYWLSFPRGVDWQDRNSLHRLTKALVDRLRAEQSEVFWSATERATSEGRADLQGRVRRQLFL